MAAGLSSPFPVGPEAGPVRETLPALLGGDRIPRRTEEAWTGLKPTLEGLIGRTGARRVLEIGSGRHPFFTPAEAERLGFDLVVNDIDAQELSHAPGAFARMIFDIAQDIEPRAIAGGGFDLIFSRMVFEHVKDAGKAWSNVRALLAPGGIGFAFVPTLWSPPFVANRLMPDAVTAPLVRMLDSTRNEAEIPKFPAYYRACRASEASLRPFLTGLGFREVSVVPFFGTPYLPRIPVLRHLARALDSVAERRDWRALASYAYIVART